VAEAVGKLVDYSELRAMYGSEAKQLVESRFTLEHTLDAMEKVYELIR
jgi:glycosyltransferase involved in cell wall biosynthesis